MELVQLKMQPGKGGEVLDKSIADTGMCLSVYLSVCLLACLFMHELRLFVCHMCLLSPFTAAVCCRLLF